MRVATLIISVVLMLVAGVQACAVAVGGSVAEDLSTAAKDKQEAEDLAGAGAAGVLGALLWLVAAAFVLSKPRVSMWIFSGASILWLIAGAAGFTDGFVWMVASIVFALMSWRGIREKKAKDEGARARYDADVAVAAAARQPVPQVPPAGWYPNPAGAGKRYWDGTKWTEHLSGQS